METKKITLRSQTVQCPHCGEYYSVTYKYCPFCDAGRQEEERKLAEKKKKKQAFFGNLFGSHEPEKKKKQANPDVYLVFLTSHSEFASESYIIEAYQYILKKDI